jgi:hypothetical protein
MKIVCPQCGGDNQVPSGERLLVCTWCEATLYVDRSGAVSHYRVERLQGRDEAERNLRRWMAGNDTVKDLDRDARVESMTPVLFPVWMFRLRGGDGDSVRVEPAAPTPIAQLAELQVPAGKLEPFDAPTADDREAASETVPATVPLETARQWLGGPSEDTEVLETALVHLPLWRATYSYKGASYTAMVEAATGKVLAAVFPAKAEAPFVLVAILALVLFGLEGFIPSYFGVLVAYLVTAVPLLGLAYWVTRTV